MNEGVNLSSLRNVNLKKTERTIKNVIIMYYYYYYLFFIIIWCFSVTPSATLRETPVTRNHQKSKANTTKIKGTFLQTRKATTHPNEEKQ